MTRKHFQAVAHRLSEAIRLSQLLNSEKVDLFVRESITKLAVSHADDFEQFSPQFDREKFLAVALG